MILEKAYYQENFAVGPFLYKHYGLSGFIEVEKGETHKEVYEQLKERVYAQFRADNPHLEEQPKGNLPAPPFGSWQTTIESPPNEPPTEKPQPKQTIEQATIAQINEVTDKTVLESFWLITKKYPAVKEAYDNRLKEITNANIAK